MDILFSTPDVAVSFICGTIAAAVIIWVSPKGENVTKVKETVEDEDVTQASHQPTKEDIQKVLNQSPHLKKFFGVDNVVTDTKLAPDLSPNTAEDKPIDETDSTATASESTLRPDSQRDTLKKILGDQAFDSETNLEETDALAWISWILFLALCAAGLYFLNVGSKGEFGRFIAGIFPVETSALKIKDYLERV